MIIQARLKRLEEEKQSQQSNPEGIVGYKKIKIHESLSHAVNSSREGEVKTSMVKIVETINDLTHFSFFRKLLKIKALYPKLTDL